MYVLSSDTWFRHIIEGGATRVKHPRVKSRYLINKLVLVKRVQLDAEISGRLLSFAADIAPFAAAAAARANLKFRHIMTAQVHHIRAINGCDVEHEEIPEDKAHANLVIHDVPMVPKLDDNQPDQISPLFIERLAGLFIVYDPSDVGILEQLRAAPAPVIAAG